MQKYITKKNIINFILVICINFSSLFFHGFIFFLFGGVGYITILSLIIIFIFSFSLFKKSLCYLRYIVLGLIIIQVIISSISFPACSMNFKFPTYNCKCSGITKQILGGSQCMGKITRCYEYLGNENIDWDIYAINKYDKSFEVSCENFPNNINN